MSRYSIEGSTLTALGDAIRGKVGKTKEVLVPVEHPTFSYDEATEGLEDFTLSTGYYDKKVYFPLISGAVRYKVIFNYVKGYVYDSARFYFRTINGIARGSSYELAIGENQTRFLELPSNEDVATIELIISNYDRDDRGDTVLDLTIYPINAAGEIIENEIKYVFNSMTPVAMIEAIEGIEEGTALPESALIITGDCKYRFANDSWNWFIENYGNKITTNNITVATSLFENAKLLKSIPFTINLGKSCSTQKMFYNCIGLEELPVINNFSANDEIFYGCQMITSLNGNKIVRTASTFPCQNLFAYCYKLRSLEDVLEEVPDICPGNSIYGMYSVFQYCYVLDEAVNLPYIYGTYSNASYSFGNIVRDCYRLKDFTFRDGIVITSGPKAGATLSFAANTGWASITVDLTKYGMLASNKVVDDATYQALKDSPDWWTADVNYSRYNRISAVNTINSLPDLSAMTYVNTITFKGQAGSKTDGGAINTMTEAEIAVAAAKGWTVSFA